MLTSLLLLCIVSFCAGFIDSIVGGGGLLQTPAMLLILPHYPVVTILGTSKIPSFAGSSFAAYRYSRRVATDPGPLVKIFIPAFLFSILGAYTVSLISNDIVKPIILVILLCIGFYTYTNKNFGLNEQKNTYTGFQGAGYLFGSVIGFYDGFIGPGTGSFLLLCFIIFIGNDFLHASANAKLVNCTTNIGAFLYFSYYGNVLYEYAIPMACFSVAGSYVGTQLTILKGNKFVRVFFLFVIFATIVRFGMDIFL